MSFEICLLDTNASALTLVHVATQVYMRYQVEVWKWSVSLPWLLTSSLPTFSHYSYVLSFACQLTNNAPCTLFEPSLFACIYINWKTTSKLWLPLPSANQPLLSLCRQFLMSLPTCWQPAAQRPKNCTIGTIALLLQFCDLRNTKLLPCSII